MASTADFRNGLCIEFRDGLYTIVEFQHVKPGKGPAFVRTKLKNIETGRVIDNTFTSGVKIDVARIERRPHQFLYLDDIGYTFMDNSNYEQIVLQKDIVEESKAKFLKEGQEVDILFHAETEKPLVMELPTYIVMEVTYTEPGIKGDTSSGNALKPATVETGVTVMVPLFIAAGEKIKVSTEDGSYMERIK